MENGVVVVEEIRVAEVKSGDDDVAEVSVASGGGGAGGHRHRESDGDEVFEEAIEPSFDEGSDGFKLDLDGGGGESDSGFYAAEGNLSLVDEGEGNGNDAEGFAGGGVTEKGEDHEDSVVRSNENDEGVVPIVDEAIVNQEGSHVAVEGNPSEVREVEGLSVEEIKGVVGDENLVEKFVVEEKLEDRDGEDVGGDKNTGVVPIEDVEAIAPNAMEVSTEVADAEDRMEKPEESKPAVVGSMNDCDSDSSQVEGALACDSLEHQENTAVVSELGSRDINFEIQAGPSESDDNQVTSPQEQKNEGSKVEDRPSENIVSVDSRTTTSEIESSTPLSTSTLTKDVESDKVPSESNSTEQSSNVSVGNGHAIEEAKGEKESQTIQSSREAVKKPELNSVSSSGKSANSTAPPARPAGLGRAAPLLEPAPRVAPQPRANGQAAQAPSSLVEDTSNGEVEEGDEIREKLQMIRVKFLRLAHRLGQTPHNVVVAQVLYRLGLAEQLRARNGGRVGAFSFDRASAMAEQLEATGGELLDFSCTIMVLGKSGVGKSATINSIFDEVKFNTDAFQMGTKKVQDVVGTVQGIKVRVIDTPGLLPSCIDQRQNEKILHSVKRFIKKSPPDIVLYLDRLDMPSRDFGDMPLLRTITEIFGPSIWFNAIVVLTHAASAPPEGPNGTASTYDMFVTQRSHAVQQAIRQAAGDMRLMNPVSLVENHSACRTNRAGQRVLPNGQVWKPHLLLLSFASKILAEANMLLKLQDTPPGKPFAARSRAPSLPLLLSSLLQSRPQLKLPDEQFGDDDTMDDDLDASSESDDESEYDELPSFSPLTKAQLAKLSKAQRKAYFDELEYREKLFMKKQLKEERRRRKMMKKMEAAAKDMPGEFSENVEEESGVAASLPVPIPDVPLPASFDSDNPTHRYRCLDTSNQWLVRPALDSHGWDHDVGYEGVNVERMFVVKDKIPVSFSGQISRDKKDSNVQMEVASSIKHGEGKATTLGFDMQCVGKDMAYTLRSETRFSNYRRNKATAGISATVLGDALSAGVKLEDKLIMNKQFRLVMSGGAMAGRGDVAYGGSLEATFRDKDYPVGRFLSTLGLSVMDWHGELALGGNIQMQIPIGRFTNLVARANLNNRGSGQVSLRLNSSEQLQLALIGMVPLLRKLIGQYQELSFGH